MTIQRIEIEMHLPTSNRRANRWATAAIVKQQRWLTRRGLETMAVRPRVPVSVRLTRVSAGSPDSDRAALSLAAVRDETARWIHGLPAYELRGGQPRVPRAPDGPGDGIEWNYATVKCRRGYSAVRIEIVERGER